VNAELEKRSLQISYNTHDTRLNLAISGHGLETDAQTDRPASTDELFDQVVRPTALAVA
jgi:hypothetical protein